MISLPPDFMQKFQSFRYDFEQARQDPQQAVQQLLNSGRMSQSQFNQFRQIANQVLGTNY